MIEVEELKLVIEPRLSSVLDTVSNFLAEQDINSYIVGGFVRDVLLGRETADIDIAVDADALEVALKIAAIVGGKYVPLDDVNRVGRVVIVNEEAGATDNRLELDFSTLKGNIEQDLAQRDFTIDAIAINLKELDKGELIDPFNGWNDLRQRVLRVVSETALKSDAARLLRAVRLAAELDFGIDNETEPLIKRDSHLVSGVAGERIREELLRLIAIPRAGQLLHYLDELSLVTTTIPELAQTKRVAQPKEHFWNVFDHSLRTVAAVDFLLRQGSWEYAREEVLTPVPWSAMLSQHFEQEVSRGSTRRSLLKLAALLHDIAKPQTQTIEADGRTRFLEHAKEGAAMATETLERLRFSTKEIKLVETVVRHHLRPGQMSNNGLPSRRAIYRYFRDTGEAGVDILFLSLADHLATRGPQLNLAQWEEHVQTVEYVLARRLEQESADVPSKLVDGHDLIDIFGMISGPEIGELLEAMHEARAAGELTTREEALAFLRERLSNKVGQ